ncbi:hypothetical protein RHGRI_000988 [Rhododendron griersonianum]|uniref:Uncharacterized protein n=1 Tax=Rhododendron griersonianum TaxID=479676 RepID=A0AAV6LJT3_9ERIC|nr:hypothetical protein RHGRI_000988 [Rhododendron griersonianum]
MVIVKEYVITTIAMIHYSTHYYFLTVNPDGIKELKKINALLNPNIQMVNIKSYPKIRALPKNSLPKKRQCTKTRNVEPTQSQRESSTLIDYRFANRMTLPSWNLGAYYNSS